MTGLVSRGVSERARVVHRWRAPIPNGATLVCADDEEVAFVRHGALLGSLGPGTHLLRIDRVPFLAIAAGAELDAELWFVSRALRSVRVRGTFAGLRSLRIGSMLSGSMDGNAEVGVHDTRALLIGLVQRGGVGDDVGAFVARLANDELVRAAEAKEIETADLMAASSRAWSNAAPLERAIASALSPHGVGMQSLSLRLIPDEATRKALGGMGGRVAVDPTIDADGLRRFRAALQPGFRVSANDATGRVYVGTVVSTQNRSCQVAWDGGGETWIEVARLGPLTARGAGALQVVIHEQPLTTLPSASEAAAAAVAIAGTIVAGTRVLVDYEGTAYPAAVQQFSQGWYEVAWDNGARAWVPSTAVRAR